jgi:hypothetical protein
MEAVTMGDVAQRVVEQLFRRQKAVSFFNKKTDLVGAGVGQFGAEARKPGDFRLCRKPVVPRVIPSRPTAYLTLA